MPNTGAVTNSMNVYDGSARRPSADLDKDGFLKLLTAQMRNQDPQGSQDPSQQFQTISMMTMVEQMTNMAKAAADQANDAKAERAAALIGRTVTYTGADGAPASGVVESVDLTGDQGPRLTVAGIAGIDPAVLREVR